MSYEIEKGVPIPTIDRKGERKYPRLETLAVGDSFFAASQHPEQLQTYFARQWGRLRPLAFTSRKENGGVRIWRTA